MTNFKSGSGNLDFGDEEPTADDREAESFDERGATADTDDDAATQATADRAEDGPAGGERYPYFVRRNNVGDERDTRLEIHVRDKVADREAGFRHALADKLDASDVSKTDAREFALLAAFEHPEQVARLMREEGFDTLG